MLLYSKHYGETEAELELVKVLHEQLDMLADPILVLCIGSDRHILDCFGPLIGSMLQTQQVSLPVFGTLDLPVHAKNLPREIISLRRLYPEAFTLAVDASLGNGGEIGVVKIKSGPLLPGKAMGKKLPAVGEMSLLGVVGDRNSETPRTANSGTLSHVYHMAGLVSRALSRWDRERGGRWG